MNYPGSQNSYNKTNPRVRLINSWSLIILVLVTITTLWALAPTREMLVELIARSTSPKISLAFLDALDEKHKSDNAVLFLVAENHFTLNNFSEALAAVNKILNKKANERDWRAYKLKLQILLTQIQQKNLVESKQAKQELSQFINQSKPISNPEVARIFADAALSISEPRIAYEILLPHFGSGIVDDRELASLALQTSDYPSAFAHQRRLFLETNQISHLNELIKLNAMTGAFYLQLEELFNSYTGELVEHPDYLEISLDYFIEVDNKDKSIQIGRRLVARSTKIPQLVNLADKATQKNMLSLSRLLLEKSYQAEPSKKIVQNLHDIYLWQGELDKAQKMSMRLIAFGANEAQIRQAIKESKAIADLYSEGILYTHLADMGKLRKDEYDYWIDTIEKSLGTRNALKQVQTLAKIRSKDFLLLAHLARLKSYIGDHAGVVGVWQKMKLVDSPTPAQAQMISTAYIRLNQPEEALNVLISVNDWIEQDLSYLQSVFGLAWNLGKKELAIRIQSQIQTLKEYDLSSDENFYRTVQLKGPFNSNDIARLSRYYQNWNNPQILLLAINIAIENEDYEELKNLLQLAEQDTRIANDQRVLLSSLRLALFSNNAEEAASIFAHIEQIYPNYSPAITSYMWWLINNHYYTKLEALYKKYKNEFYQVADYWLLFAASSEVLNYLDEADYWYRRILTLLDNKTDKNSLSSINAYKPSILLNYASLLERSGNYERAYLLRRYVSRYLVDQLLKLEQGEVAYHSLVYLLAGSRKGHELMTSRIDKNSSDDKTLQWFASFISNKHINNLQFWHRRPAFEKVELPPWQKLSIAIVSKDKQQLAKLLEKPLGLPEADKNLALQMLGDYQSAWEQGEAYLTSFNDRRAMSQLRRVQVAQHPYKTRGMIAGYQSITQWDIESLSFGYYQPTDNGKWRLDYLEQRALLPQRCLTNRHRSESRLVANYHHRFDNSQWKINLDLADGIGKQRLGLQGEYSFEITPYWRASITAGIDQHSEASQLMALAGKDSNIFLQGYYRPSKREELSMLFGFHQFKTRHDENIASGWEIRVRASEHLFFADPAFTLYAEYAAQKFNLVEQSLGQINQEFSLEFPLVAADFINQSYSRISFGQRISHGSLATTGAQVPSPRYWLDTSIGYNSESEQSDFTLSSGLGWRLLGDDELSFSVDWQSQDINGDESLRLSLDYYYNW